MTPVGFTALYYPLAGDFNDNGELDSGDSVALLLAVHQPRQSTRPGRRMDMNQDGAITMADFEVWMTQLIHWQRRGR